MGSMAARSLPPPLPAELVSSWLPPLSPSKFAGGSVSEPCALSTLPSQPGDPHSSAAQPPHLVLLRRRLWRRLTTLNAHRCGVSGGWERVTKLYR